MLFLRYESFRDYLKYYPVTTLLLFLMIAVHAGIYIASLATGIPAEEWKVYFGLFINQPPFNDVDHLWRYVASIFLHNDFLHLLFNSFTVFVFAPPMERILGKIRYLFMFLFAGVIGNVFTNLYPNLVASLGASGAVYGIFGAYLFIALFRKRLLDDNSRKTLYAMIIVGVIYSVAVPGINLLAHLGGFIGGFVIVALYSVFLRGRYV
ncbi:rhomboid family intramembrane serine protease [Paenibacillus thermotolerans]|uniref:rhomboid family intramembrane serine protease n=1 Tax=Paenibacillus thermotolerans TaxID=3027807 RepID=UPI002367A288|nr:MULTISPECIES: rhomboid family intramembrane serine protease [unclassified Paenibacillus]